MTPVSPVTKAARQAQIVGILTHTRVRSQDELAELLVERGVRVTQATLSRDLEELGAVRLRGAGGALVYALPGRPGGPGSHPGGQGPRVGGTGTTAGVGGPDPSRKAGPRVGHGPGTAAPAGWARAGMRGEGGMRTLSRIAPELLVSAEASANLVVVRTPAGGAQLLASAIDHAAWVSILGTVAGDDTVLVITRDPAGGEEVAGALVGLAERRTGHGNGHAGEGDAGPAADQRR